jgi:phage terminase large subunit-like protein
MAYYDEKAAQRFLAFVEKACTHVKGPLAKKPFLLEDWQKDYFSKLLGWKQDDGRRQYRESFLFLPRKNGKSNMIAALGLYMLFVDKEAGAEIYVAAGDRAQANAVFSVMKQMVLNQPLLENKCKIYRDSIVLNNTNSFIKAISADSETKHGLNASCIIVDELHTQPNLELYEVLQSSTGARAQPLTVGISTAGNDRGHLCRNLYEYSKKVMSGSVQDKAFLPVIYEAPHDADIFDIETVKLANPNYGISIFPDYIEREWTKAKASPSDEIKFRTLHLNQWLTNTEGWISDTDWMQSTGSFNEAELLGATCYAGLDLAATADITAFTMVFPWHDGTTRVLCKMWVNEEQVNARRGRTGASYDAFVASGHLTVTEGNVTDYEVVEKDILELCERYNVKGIAYDRWNSTALVTNLVDKGVPMSAIGQGFASMSQPTKEVEIMIKAGTLHHNGNPVLRWMAGNAQAKYDDAYNIKLVKNKSSDKIDGVIALIMAIAEKMSNEREDTGPSYYEEHGLRML